MAAKRKANRRRRGRLGAPLEPVPSLPVRERLPAVDCIKAAAIAAVVLTHALLEPAGGEWVPSYLRPTLLDTWLHFAVQFCVPAFLLASGVLHGQGGPLDGPTLRRRLTRIVGPYLIASAVAQVGGFSGAETPWDVAFQLATGASLFIYYYVFLLVICLLLTWPLERLHPRGPEVTLAALAVYGIATTFVPGPPESFFWQIRNPVHFYGYFLAGLVAWRHRATLARLRGRAAGLAAAACAAGVGAYVAAGPGLYYSSDAAGALRALYTLSLVGLVALVGSHREPPAAILFLSRASYAIYLYHFFFESLAAPSTLRWPAGLRIAAVVGAGLIGATVLCIAGARLLGTRARPLLGV